MAPRMVSNNARGAAVFATWKMTERPWRTTFAPILTKPSRRKLAGLQANAGTCSHTTISAKLRQLPHPGGSAVALLGPLRHSTAMIIEHRRPLCSAVYVDDNEADPWIRPAGRVDGLPMPCCNAELPADG